MAARATGYHGADTLKAGFFEQPCELAV